MAQPVGLIETMKLVDDQSGDELVLWPSLGSIYVIDLDLGFPSVRVNSVDLVGQSGTRDYTSTFGASTVALTLRYRAVEGVSAMQARDELVRWLNPRKRPRLVYTLVGCDERDATLSPRQASNALSMAFLRSSVPDVQLQWANPLGRSFSTEVFEVVLTPNSGTGLGRRYNLVYPRVYSTTVPPDWTPDVEGNVETYPTIVIQGPVTSPSITNVTLGLTLAFDGLALDANETLTIDTANKTAVVFDGLNTTNVRGSLTQAGWWPLNEGTNTLVFDTDVFSTDTTATVTYRAAFL